MTETHRRRVVGKICTLALRVGESTAACGAGSRSASMARLRIRRGRGPRARTRPSAARAHRRSQTGASKGQKGARTGLVFVTAALYLCTSLFRALAARGGYKSIHGPVEA